MIVILCCLGLIFSGCNKTKENHQEKNDMDTYYTITFDSQGGSLVESEQVLKGNLAKVPSSPTKESFDFQGWYRSIEENATRWNFSIDRVYENITLYAHWTLKEKAPTVSNTLTYEQNTSKTGYIVTGDSGQAPTIVIPEEYNGKPVVGIADSAFAYSRHTSEIHSISIPDSVTEIGKNAFHNQDALVSVNISTTSKLEKIGNNAFSGNSALESIYLPQNFIDLGEDVFNNCGGLNTIVVDMENSHYSSSGNCLIDLETNTLLRGSNQSVIPEIVKKIGVAAFRKAKLTTLTIPTSITSIEKYAISDSAITKIIYNVTTEEWENVIHSSSKYWNMGKENIEITCLNHVETMHVLVAYFSATGTTKQIAEIISSLTGGDLYEIVPIEPYTKEDLNYSSSCRCNDEQNNPLARPLIKGTVDTMEIYDVVFLGYPIWWGKAPKIIYTFLESYEFVGKKIVPFCTSGSSPISGSLPDIQAIANDATWLSSRRFSSGTEVGVIQSWLDSLTY